MYIDIAKEKSELLKTKKDAIILAIESSCDETAAAILKGNSNVLSNVIATQIDIHKIYGGVVPEIASRQHIKAISPIVQAALDEAGITFADIDAIAVTVGPGLVGALLVGVSYAKALAFSLGIPLIPVNHIEGHIAGAMLSNKELVPPFLCLVVSGGHSTIVLVKDYLTYEKLGETRDDAIGECFDKVARVLGLSYPGGPLLEQLALNGDEKAYTFHSKFNDDTSHYDMSFSGIKTSLINTIDKLNKAGTSYKTEDIAASFQNNAMETLCKKTLAAAIDTGVKSVAIAGGVSANIYLREMLKRYLNKNDIDLHMPEMIYCTDNAAMIGRAAFDRIKIGEFADLTQNADPSWHVF